jgi:BirA family biotin operon repressor/biotin-[acetyl-CoA-carboxylase] ligase
MASENSEENADSLTGTADADSLTGYAAEGAWKGARGRWKILLYNSVSSTNDVAKELIKNHLAGNWYAVIANHQWAGRGRFRRTWLSPYGLNVYMTLIVPPVEPQKLPLLNLALSLAAVNALNGVASVSAWPRWPNDIYSGEKKLGGILSETAHVESAGITHVLMGIGINVNSRSGHFPPEIRRRATSLLEETGVRVDRWEAIKPILDEFPCLYANLDEDGAPVVEKWTKATRTVGRSVRINTAGGEIAGTALGINERGMLLVELPSKERITVTSGDLLNEESL